MITQDYTEVKNNVSSRIEYLKREMEKIEEKLSTLETQADEYRKILMQNSNRLSAMDPPQPPQPGNTTVSE